MSSSPITKKEPDPVDGPSLFYHSGFEAAEMEDDTISHSYFHCDFFSFVESLHSFPWLGGITYHIEFSYLPLKTSCNRVVRDRANIQNDVIESTSLSATGSILHYGIALPQFFHRCRCKLGYPFFCEPL